MEKEFWLFVQYVDSSSGDWGPYEIEHVVCGMHAGEIRSNPPDVEWDLVRFYRVFGLQCELCLVEGV